LTTEASQGFADRDLRRAVIETGAIDCMLATGPKMFFTVSLPVSLWFLDKGKAKGPRADQVLFVDARHLYRQVTRAHRVFDADHIEFLGNIVRLWRGEKVETTAGSSRRMAEDYLHWCAARHYRRDFGWQRNGLSAGAG
jgi:type I restriction enzyme M protein